MDTPKRLQEESEALTDAGKDMLFIPLHQQPMAWATRTDISHVVQLSDNKVRLWLTHMAPQ